MSLPRLRGWLGRLAGRLDHALDLLVSVVIDVIVGGALIPFCAVAAEPRWRAGEAVAFGGIQGHSVVSPPCSNACLPETSIRVECQAGTVAWPAPSRSLRGELGREPGVVLDLTLEVERPLGLWSPAASRRPCLPLRPAPTSAPTSRRSATPDPAGPRA